MARQVELPDAFRASLGPFRVVHYTDEGLYRVENAMEVDGVFALQAGSSPFGATAEELQRSFLQYERALGLPWIAIDSAKDDGYGPFRAFWPRTELDRVDIADAMAYGFDYRVARDELGELTVFQCFFACGPSGFDPRFGYDGVQSACACGYSEEEFIADAKLYLSSLSRPWLRVIEERVSS